MKVMHVDKWQDRRDRALYLIIPDIRDRIRKKMGLNIMVLSSSQGMELRKYAWIVWQRAL